jgi:uncharacterized protein YqeY
MSLAETINKEIITAMKARDEASLRGLRAIKSAILLAQTDKGVTDALTADTELKILQKLAKQRKDSLEIYEQQKREDLAVKEREEIAVIERFLPKQMSEEEITAVLKQIIAQTGAITAAETGKVMPVAMKELAGKADGKTISAILKSLLA